MTALLEAFVAWVEHEPIGGLFSYAAVQVVCTIFVVPAWVLVIGAGAAFGSALGLGLGVGILVNGYRSSRDRLSDVRQALRLR